MCGATEGGLSLDGVNVAKEAVIQGQVLRALAGGQSEPVSNAYVRLLDRTGEFTAEVPTSATGHFRFFAGDGEWTLRTLAPKVRAGRHPRPRGGRLGGRGQRLGLTAPTCTSRPALTAQGGCVGSGVNLRSIHTSIALIRRVRS